MPEITVLKEKGKGPFVNKNGGDEYTTWVYMRPHEWLDLASLMQSLKKDEIVLTHGNNQVKLIRMNEE